MESRGNVSSEQIPAGKMDLNDIHDDPYHG